MSLDYTVGQRLGDYEILGILGAGGMGKVYKVRNVISDRIEAMKILLPDLAGQKELADRFLREIKVLASLNHPNIAALRTALTLDNQLVMIMEFVDGVTLSSRLHQGAIPPSLAVKYIDQVLQALSYAHKQNIIHRDIKPANMMLMADGTVKLMDFGIARSASDRSLTMTGTTLGSLNYMPPEQVKGEPADNRSDLYSLGVSLYEMVTGQLPFQADSNYAIMAAHLQEEPRPPIVLRPGIPQTLNQIILMALAKDPSQRFQSADAFRGALKSVPTQGEATQPATSPQSYAPAAAGGATALFQETPASQSPTTVMNSPAYQRQPASTPQPTMPMAAAAQAQAAAPQMPPPTASGSSHRGLYIALGALIVVAVLFAAGLYLPSHLKTLAGAAKNAISSQQSQPANSPAAASSPTAPSTPADAPASPASPSGPADASAGTSAPTSAPTPGAAASSPQAQSSQPGQSAPVSSSASSAPSPDTSSSASAADASSSQPAKKSSATRPKKHSQSAQADSQQQSAAQPSSAADTSQPAVQSQDQVPAQPEDAAQAEEVEQKYDDLDSRATAASQSLDNLQRQQAAAGYGLRGDIVSAQQRMRTDMSKAQYFMQKQDSKNAQKYLKMAEAELQTLEKFLGH
jgi:eukaryotic-like serine/threonine-protein kinase